MDRNRNMDRNMDRVSTIKIYYYYYYYFFMIISNTTRLKRFGQLNRELRCNYVHPNCVPV